ncbi:MAG: nucleoside triphosphate pyrophosphohydrolase [Chloroflexi bacterium]|nr:nucleoside triphosphate pyrophosphohydrolase [Chloroflexota bacterium]
MSGITQLESVFSALGLETFSSLTLLDADALRDAHVPPFPPDMPALIVGVDAQVFPGVKRALAAVYPDGHPMRVVHADGTVTDADVGLLGQNGQMPAPVALYLPPLEEGASFEAFQEIVAHLRAPDGCPWDRKQTHQTLRPHLLEEAYEALSAMDADDSQAMAEEFGDLLLQIVLNAQIASESGNFAMSDVIKGIHDKIVRRHPHVFGTVHVDGVGEVLQNWEQLKEAERDANGETEKGLLDGVPLSFPALNQSQEYQDRAARVGFDWPEIEGVLDKIAEEIEEVRQAENGEELAAELGDLFFALVNLARWKGVDAESALRGTNARFKKRFAHIEQSARRQGRHLSDLTLDEMEALWQEAKRTEKK